MAGETAGVPGAGAVGGLGHAAMLLGAKMVSGADFFLDLLCFDEQMAGCELVITGEGTLDTQTLSGKLPLVVARRAAPVPAIVVVVKHNALGVGRLPNQGIGRIHALSTMTGFDSAADPELSAALLREIGRRITRALSSSPSTTAPLRPSHPTGERAEPDTSA